MTRKLVVNVRECNLTEVLRRLVQNGDIHKFSLKAVAESSKEIHFILIFNDKGMAVKNLIDSLVARRIIDDFRTMGVARSTTHEPEPAETVH